MPSIVDKSSVKMVCVDDFALRKRFSYGTVMINLENHRIVDMIPSRDTNDVCNWLKTFHNIEVISRDGAITYASAATNSHPDVIQISDRFHLIKGLSEVICKYIFREFPHVWHTSTAVYQTSASLCPSSTSSTSDNSSISSRLVAA